MLTSAALKHFCTNTCFFKFIGNLIGNFNIEVEITKISFMLKLKNKPKKQTSPAPYQKWVARLGIESLVCPDWTDSSVTGSTLWKQHCLIYSMYTWVSLMWHLWSLVLNQLIASAVLCISCSGTQSHRHIHLSVFCEELCVAIWEINTDLVKVGKASWFLCWRCHG